MLILFFCLIFQRYANPYTDENVDRLEFAQLFFAHFLLFLGVVYFALAPNEDEACLALTELSLNATSADDVDQEERARCRAQEDVQDAFKVVRSIVGYSLKLIFLGYVVFHLAHLQWEVRKAIRRRLRQEEEAAENKDPKLASLFKLADRVIAPKLLPLAREWIEKSNEKERDYFRGLLVLIDNHYQDWDDRQAKSTREFLSQSASQLASQLKTLYSILKAAVSIITCMRTRRVTGVELQIQKPPEGQGEARAGPRAWLSRKFSRSGGDSDASGSRRLSKGRLSFRRDGGGGAADNVVEDNDDDLLEAYLALQQATDDASSKGQAEDAAPAPDANTSQAGGLISHREEPSSSLASDSYMTAPGGRGRNDSVGSGEHSFDAGGGFSGRERAASGAAERSVGFSAKLDRLGEERDSGARWSEEERD